VSFDPAEEAALSDAGVTGELNRPAGDNLFVTTWNSGGDKLDYWARRFIEHMCDIRDRVTAHCHTTVTIKNIVAENLSRTVANRPYGLMKTFAELYVPETAQIVSVRKEGTPVKYVADHQDGLATIGVYTKIPMRESRTVEVSYDLPLHGKYSLRVIPQPLAIDPHLKIKLSFPDDWTTWGFPADSGEVAYEGVLDRPLSVTAGPPGTTGLSALWDRLVDFWKGPVF
jgi:hypothetical protein